MRIGPARNIARGIDPWDAGLQECIHSNAAVELKAGLLGQTQAGTHSNAHNYDIAVQHAAALERHALAIDSRHSIAEMKDDAVLFVQRTDEVAHGGAQHALPPAVLRRHAVEPPPPRAPCPPDPDGGEDRAGYRST